MRTRTTLISILVLFLVIAVPASVSDASSDIQVLVDKGNGETEWYDSTGNTVEAILKDASIRAGIDRSFTKDIGAPSTGGSFDEAGTTGVTVHSQWNAYGWNGTSWSIISDTSVNAKDSGYSAFALGFYPVDPSMHPVVTPSDPIAHTMVRKDALNSGSQNVTFSSSDKVSATWSMDGAAHATALYANGYIFQKFGVDKTGYAKVVCLDASNGNEIWMFQFVSSPNYESSTPLIVGDHIFVATMTGYIYRMPWATGPGEDNCDVISFDGSSFSTATKVKNTFPDKDYVGKTYDAGFASMVFDSGAIYVEHSNGMVYCLNTDLQLVWSYLMGGHSYFIAPTVVDGMVFAGALNGYLYVLDASTGGLLTSEAIYQKNVRGKLYGGIGNVSVIKNTDVSYTLYFTVSDGLGMSQSNSGLAVYDLNTTSNTLVKRYLSDELGVFGRYVTAVDNSTFTGAYFVVHDGIESKLGRIDRSGNITYVTKGLAEIHSPMYLVNDKYLYAVSYSGAKPIYKIDLNGNIAGVAYCAQLVRNFNMVPLLVLGDTVFGGTDSGIYRLDGSFIPYTEEHAQQGQPIIIIIAEIVAGIAIILGAVYAVMRYRYGIEKPFSHLKGRFLHYLYGEDYSHNTRNKHRLKFVVLMGVISTLGTMTLCLCIGSGSIQSPLEAYSSLFSAISKGGQGLTLAETDVYMSRFPRTIAAMAVGIGLSVAGCIYQAIIRNPLVDPYIMGVSSGAGVAAIAVIAFDFTFFGLFSSHSIFLVAVTATIGGVIAFMCTMFLAERSGGQAINYVLSGVVIGLAFSAIQTLMLTMAGQKLNNALTWLYGSFAEITWSQVGVVAILAIALSLVPLIWSREFNLVLLGEDQARQMGLNVRVFNRWMLILASVLTSICVSFVGIIGFVGLVVPHLCRMLLGSDHRMVIPASICFGGVVLMLADLLARTGYYGMELPVGAITTVIGIPVFAYLLIKRGRMYDG